MKLSKVKRICPICGIEFAPKTINSRYCSEKCSRKAYKRKVAEEKRQQELNAIAESVPDNRPYISVPEAIALYGVAKSTLYRYAQDTSPLSISEHDCYASTDKNWNPSFQFGKNKRKKNHNQCSLTFHWKTAIPSVKSLRNTICRYLQFPTTSVNTEFQCAIKAKAYTSQKQKFINSTNNSQYEKNNNQHKGVCQT